MGGNTFLEVSYTQQWAECLSLLYGFGLDYDFMGDPEYRAFNRLSYLEAPAYRRVDFARLSRARALAAPSDLSHLPEGGVTLAG